MNFAFGGLWLLLAWWSIRMNFAFDEGCFHILIKVFIFFIKKMCRSILACLGMYEHFAPPWNIESLSDSPLLQLGHRTFG